MKEKRDYVIQVDKEHYCDKKYDSLARFINYFYQIDLIRQLDPQSILEIGVGNKTVSNYLRQQGHNITTCDHDGGLEPDYVADIRELGFENGSFDAVMACEILEHIPWEDVDKALGELGRVTRRYAVVSIPYSGIPLELLLRIPLLGRIIKRPFMDLFWMVPRFYSVIKFSGEHYWEMGRKGYPIGRVRKMFEKRFKIVKEVRPVLDHGHYFFVLEKK